MARNKVLLRLRGFLHALCLVEMTIPQKNVISSVVERSPSLWYEQGQTKKYILFPTTMSFRAIHGAKREFMAKSIHDALHQFIQSIALLSSSLDKLSPSLVK